MQYDSYPEYVSEALAHLNRDCLKALLNKDWDELRKAELELLGFVIEDCIMTTDCEEDQLRTYLNQYHEIERMDWKELHNWAVESEHERELDLHKYL